MKADCALFIDTSKILNHSLKQGIRFGNMRYEFTDKNQYNQ